MLIVIASANLTATNNPKLSIINNSWIVEDNGQESLGETLGIFLGIIALGFFILFLLMGGCIISHVFYMKFLKKPWQVEPDQEKKDPASSDNVDHFYPDSDEEEEEEKAPAYTASSNAFKDQNGLVNSSFVHEDYNGNMNNSSKVMPKMASSEADKVYNVSEKVEVQTNPVEKIEVKEKYEKNAASKFKVTSV